MIRDVVRAAAVAGLVLAAGGGWKVAPAAATGSLAGGTGGSTQSAQSAVIVPPESDGVLHEAPVISSKNGVLKANVDLIRAGTPGSNRPVLFGGTPIYSDPDVTPPSPGQPPFVGANPPHFPLNFAGGYQFTTSDGAVYPAQFPAPTLHLQPGDILDLTQFDKLGNEKSGEALPPGAELSNLHTHGLIVSPLGDSDNVVRTIDLDKGTRTRIEVPKGHSSGVDWYHVHRHGFVSDQVYAGLAGNLVVGDPLDPWPQYAGKYQERSLALTAGITSVDTKTGLRYLDDLSPFTDTSGGEPAVYGSSWRKYVNGQYNPTMTIRPGETQVWNLTDMGRNGNYNLGLTDANGQNPWKATILAYDGDGANANPWPITLAQQVPYTYDGAAVLDPGERITMAVTAPTKPGTYYLEDDMSVKLRPQGSFFALATIKVEGTPNTEPAPVFTATGPTPDLFTATPDHKRTFIWSNDTSQPTIRFAVNGTFFPNNPIVPLQVGQVEEWLLVNTSNIDHVFHIHQNNVAVISVNTVSTEFRNTNPYTDPNPFRYVSLRDSINIPPGDTVLIRFRVSPQLGKYVFHCHILPHEDAGMMMAVLALPNETQRRIALGPSSGKKGSVLVNNGTGHTVGRIQLKPATTGGAVTATGIVNGDMIEDIVIGQQPSAGSPASVSLYDGQTLKLIKRFTPFPKSPKAGVSVAIGDIDHDGRGEIIVGFAGPGPSLVRIFHSDGTLVREIKGTLSGPLPHGVTVSSADYNGDNFDDVAIGAGAGAAPKVVGLDGYTLTGPSAVKQLFSLTAIGGSTAGVNLASGYFDPRTRPGVDANLITTPQTGPMVGKVQVWTPIPLSESTPAGSTHDHGSTGPPKVLALLQPMGKAVPGGLHIAVTRLGKQGYDALVAWSDPSQPVYISIDDQGSVSRLQPESGSKVVKKSGAGLWLTFHTVPNTSAHSLGYFCRLLGVGARSAA